MSMEKITKEELQEKLLGTELSDGELENVSGGRTLEELNNCYWCCQNIYDSESDIERCKKNCMHW